MNISILEHNTVGVTFVPDFWWTDMRNLAINANVWVTEASKNDDAEYLVIDPDYEAEIQMENYERIRDGMREDGINV